MNEKGTSQPRGGSRRLGRARSAWRLAAVLLVIVVSLARWAAICVRGKRRGLVERALWLRSASRLLLRMWGIKVKKIRTKPAVGIAKDFPNEAGLVVCNHLGYLDILVLAGMGGPAVFVSKSEVKKWPVLGRLATMSGTLFVNRSRRGDIPRLADEMAMAMAAGVNVVVFLEGTSSDGSRVLPFKTSLLEPVIKRRCPVFPMALDYAVPHGYSASREVCWWGEMPLLPHLLNMLAIPCIRARVAQGSRVEPGETEDRKALAGTLHERVESSLLDLRENSRMSCSSQ